MPNFTPLALGDVAKIEEGLADIRRTSRVAGLPAVGMGVRKQRGSNAVAVARAVRAKMAELQKELPPGVTLGLNFDSQRNVCASACKILRL